MKAIPLTRRLISGTIGLVIGTVGALALASPASAHKVFVDGDVFCDDTTGEWVITWTVENSENHAAELTMVSLEPAPEQPLSTIVAGATLPARGQPLTEEHRLAGDAGISEVTLELEATWQNGVIRTKHHTIYLDGDCELRLIDLHDRVAANCDLLVFLIRNNEDQDLTLTLTPSADTRHGHAPDVADLIDDPSDALVPPAGTQLVDVADAGAGEPIALTIPPGALHAHGFEAFPGLSVSSEVMLGGQDMFQREMLWDSMVAGLDCDGGGGEAPPGLPVTGAATTLMAAGALALLALGAGLFLVARRRQVTFTA